MGKNYRAAKIAQIETWRGKMPECSQSDEIPLRSPNQGIHYGGRAFVGGRPMMIVAKGNKRDSMTPEEVLSDIYGRDIESINIKLRTKPSE